MAFWKKNRQETKNMPVHDKSLNPVLHVMKTLKDYHSELVQKEGAGPDRPVLRACSLGG